MHFYYLDESGDTGTNLEDKNQPIFVLGGTRVREAGWNSTQQDLEKLIADYFGSAGVSEGFELHTHELLGPQGKGPFAGHADEKRYGLCISILDLLIQRKHGFHYFAASKPTLLNSSVEAPIGFDPKVPYLLAFDYLVTYINWEAQQKLGKTQRAMIILDQKPELHDGIEQIMNERRYRGAKAHRVKQIAEFCYPVDSKQNSMIQLSDLVVYCVRRFLEVEHGYHDAWSEEAKIFYARCFQKISGNVKRQGIVDRKGKGMESLNNCLKTVQVKTNQRWKQRYALEPK